jgi:hypothetical protein
LPSQRFSRSQGFAPPAICRPCFMPVPPLGFPPPEIFSGCRALGHLSVSLALLRFTPGIHSLAIPSSSALWESLAFRSGTSRLESVLPRALLQGFALCRRPSPRAGFYATSRGPRPLDGFPPQGLPSAAPGLPFGPSSLELSRTFLLRDLPTGSPEFLAALSAWPSQALPPLSRFITF